MLKEMNIPYTATAKETPQGYKGFHVVWYDGNIGNELQLSTPEAWKVKMETEKIYAKWRDEEAKPGFMDQEPEEHKEDMKKSARLWAQLSLPDFSSFDTSLSESTRQSSSISSPSLIGERSSPQTPPENSPTGQPVSLSRMMRPESVNATTISSPSTSNISQHSEIGNAAINNSESAPDNGPDGLGAANKGFADSAFNDWVNNAGQLHDIGEKAVRNVSLPKENLEGKATMKTGQTVMEAEQTPESRIPTLENMYVNGELAYVPITNADRAAKASQIIERDGWDTALADWTAKARSGKVSADLVAMGATLLNNAGNSTASAEQYVNIMIDYAKMLNSAGQSTQAARILKSLTPEGRLYSIHHSVQSLADEYANKKGVDIKLPDGLVQEY